MGEWSQLTPTFEWRRSQQHLLTLASHVDDGRWHLSAPPGAGKTLIGLELARHVDRPTVVLAPSRAIRDQWRRSTAMFGADPETFATTDPEVAAPLLAITYQLLGNPGAATDELQAAARRLWQAEVALEHGDDGAGRRIAATEANDPARAAAELRRHVRKLRRSLGTGEPVGVPVADLLGERTHRLLDLLVDRDIGCVVLDECHHLLDWWALVVTALVERLDPAVVGLTATLPDPDSSREADNYVGLLGPVDAELHLAAMVAEGALAPWRDAVHLTPLEPDEQRFLDGWAEAFADQLDELLARETFIEWAVARVVDAAIDARAPANIDDAFDQSSAAGWDRFWDHDPLAALALARWWHHRGLALPAGFRPPDDADVDAPLRTDDRLVLLDVWIHHGASTATDEDRADLGAVTRRHGVTISTTGIRWGRSVADVVCARSAAKGRAAASVVAAELRRRGERGTALVVVERDRSGTPPAEARVVLGEDAGTATRTLTALCGEPTVVTAGVIAVTGSGTWCDAVNAERIATAIDLQRPETKIRTLGCDVAGAVRLGVDGATWHPSDWLEAAEIALDARAAAVLVATRGLVGEGWDHPPLNVLVDCSEVASRAASTQLRGRALRLDAADPDKVVSLWDVTVVHPTAPGDWGRLRRRHEHWWGPDAEGAVRTGAAKLHPLAARLEPPSLDDLAAVNRTSDAAAADHGATRHAWRTIDPGGIATAAVTVRTRRARRRVRTRTGTWRRWRTAAVAGATATAIAGVGALSLPLLAPLALAGVGVTGAFVRTAIGREHSAEDTIAALGHAVADGLRAAGVPGLARAAVTARRDPSGGVVAVIDGVDDDAAATWSAALAETLGPLESPRWLVAVGDEAWRVPGIVGSTRAAADAFAASFRDHVPRAQLLRAGTPEATQHVLRSADRRPDEVAPSLRWA